MVPAAPTNHTSPGALPQTPNRSLAWGPTLLHVQPFRERPGMAASGVSGAIPASVEVGLTAASTSREAGVAGAVALPPHEGASAPRTAAAARVAMARRRGMV